jgi:hypothetical protein
MTATQPVPGYEHWSAMLAGQVITDDVGPQPGRYRLPARRTNPSNSPGVTENAKKQPTSWPVAIWRNEGGELNVMIGRKHFLEQSEEYLAFAADTWPRCEAVTEEAYQAAFEGGSWPNENPVVTALNRAPEDNTLEGVLAAIDALEAEARKLIEKGAAKDQDEADQAADVANRLSQLAKKADDLRKKEKAPVLAEAATIETKWQNVIARADIYRRIKAVCLTPFLTKKAAEAEAAKLAEIQSGAPAPEVPRPATTAGSRGKPTGLTTVKTAVIEDYPKALAFFSENAKVKDLIQTLANAAVKQGTTPDGCKVVETKVAR